MLSGSYMVTIKNLVLNGPSAGFHISKNDPGQYGHCVRTAACPGIGTNITLFLEWPLNGGIYLRKNGTDYDGAYQYKIL
jgi:hypothetical protein